MLTSVYSTLGFADPSATLAWFMASDDEPPAAALGHSSCTAGNRPPDYLLTQHTHLTVPTDGLHYYYYYY